MKIYNPNLIKNSQGLDQNGQQAKRKSSENAQSFLDILNASTTSKTQDTQPVKKATPPVELFDKIGLTPIQEQAISKGEEVLDLLNHLTKLYNEVDRSNLSLDSVANALSSKVEELDKIKDQLEASDPLKKTIEEIGILSVVEKIKITRGDYS